MAFLQSVFLTYLRINTVEIFFCLTPRRFHFLSTLVFGLIPPSVPNGPPLAHYLWWVLGLEAKLSEENPLMAMNLSSPRMSGDASRVRLLSPLGWWPSLTTAALREDAGNGVSAAPGNSVTRTSAGTGSKLSSPAAPGTATAEISVRC